jgi:hypothetical protein
VSGSNISAAYHRGMDTLTINISWEYFLGVLGSLIALAYYTNGRFSIIETDIGWLKETLSELAINAENITAKLFRNESPASLTATGYVVLQKSGLKSYVEAKKATLLAALKLRKPTGLYEIERRSFRLLADLSFEGIVQEHLSNFAFKNGISVNILRRVGAIYLRDIAADSI